MCGSILGMDLGEDTRMARDGRYWKIGTSSGAHAMNVCMLDQAEATPWGYTLVHLCVPGTLYDNVDYLVYDITTFVRIV